MWICQLCTTQNVEANRICGQCRLKQRASRVSSATLCALHATTMKAWYLITLDGFGVGARTLGGAVEGDVYDGSDLSGSVEYGCDVVHRARMRWLTLMQITFDFDLEEVAFFDKERWLRQMSEGASAYDAMKRVAGAEIADEARMIAATGKPGEVDASHFVLAAKRLGRKAAYVVGRTHRITFLRPEVIVAGPAWFTARLPSSKRDEFGRLLEEYKRLVFRANLAGPERFASWVDATSARPSKIAAVRPLDARRALDRANLADCRVT